MGVMIVTVVVVAVLTLIGTVVWWAMMNDWEAKDRAARGRHVTERRGGDATNDGHDDDPDGPVVVKL
jgi:hypothetical protein